MIFEAITPFCILILLLIFAGKIYNVSKGGKLVSKETNILMFAFAWLFWLLIFMGLMASISFQQTSSFTDDSGTMNINFQDNSYAENSMLLSFANFLIGSITFLFILEVIQMLGSSFIQSKRSLTNRQ